MSTSASSLNWWYMPGSRRLMSSALRREAMSRNTPPCGLPRPSLTSLLIARATSSRGSRSGVRRLPLRSVYQRSASSSVSAVAGVLPGIGGDLPGLADPAGGQHHRLGAEDHEAPGLAPVAERPGDASRVGEQTDDRALHEHVDAAVADRAVLEGADHLQTGPVADVRQPGVAVPAEVALEDAAVGGAVEQRAPLLELQHPVGCLLRVELGHAPVVEHLAAAHGVAEVDAPVVLRVDVAERRGDAALRHHGVGLAEQGLADDRGLRAAGRGLDRGPQAGAAGADDDDVELVDLVISHG